MGDLLDFKDDDDYNSFMSMVNEKIEKSIQLTKAEIDNFCFALPYERKSKFSFCNDDRFNYLFLHKLDDGKTRPKLTSAQLADFENIIREWETFLKEPKQKNSNNQHIKEEYNYELGNLTNDFKNKLKTPETDGLFIKKKKEIISYNKYIYLKGIDIFPGYKFPIRITIDEKTILIDESILFHSLIRHYGEILKQTSVQKSYFTEDVLVEDIYDLILDIFNKLKERKIKIENMISFIFIYKSKYYQIYTKRIKLINHVIEYKVNSFFPIENTTRLQEIKENYTELSINENYIYLNRNTNA